MYLHQDFITSIFWKQIPGREKKVALLNDTEDRQQPGYLICFEWEIKATESLRDGSDSQEIASMSFKFRFKNQAHLTLHRFSDENFFISVSDFQLFLLE